jgi:hypothetical protein
MRKPAPPSSLRRSSTFSLRGNSSRRMFRLLRPYTRGPVMGREIFNKD